MERSFERVSTPLSAADAQDILDRNPNWLLVDLNKSPSFILRTEDLDIYISKLSSVKPEDLDAIDLMEIPATRKDVTNILLQATLGEAMNSLKTSGVQALYVNRITAPMMDSPVGIITLEDLESYYQP